VYLFTKKNLLQKVVPMVEMVEKVGSDILKVDENHPDTTFTS